MERPWRTSDEERAELTDAKDLARVVREQDGIELTYEETSRWLRLAYALTYYSAQGRTIKDRTIMLLDSASRHFSIRNPIVGISRAPLGSQIKIPTVTQEEHILNRMPAVPDELNLEVATDGEVDGADDDAGDEEE